MILLLDRGGMKQAVIILSVVLFFFSSISFAMTRDEAFQDALTGDSRAMFSLGLYSYKKIGDYPISSKDSLFWASDALYWFKKSAKKNYPPAQSSLAKMYHYGEGIDVDYDKFFLWAQKAAENGNSAGKTQMVLAYLQGHGVEQNYTQAREWLLRCDLEQDKYSQFLMGYCYELGLGFPLDLKKAYKWYSKSQSNGSVEARVRLDALCKYSAWACK